MVVGMNEKLYECPKCNEPSAFIKNIAPTAKTSDGTMAIGSGVLVTCPEHGEMAIVFHL
jgi:hypothetical protein